jgi:protein-tyrosine-phosphatase
MPLKVLVLDADSGAAVEAVQSLGRSGAVIDASSSVPNPLGWRSRYVHRKLSQPAGVAETAEWLCEVGYEYDLVIPATEVSLLAFLSERIPKPLYQKAVLAPPESIRTALDKEAVHQLAQDLGIPVPKSVLLSAGSPPPDVYPVVLKPVHSKVQTSKGVESLMVTVARDEEQWTTAVTRTYAGIELQQQSYVSGRGTGIEVLFNRGEMLWAFMHERIHEYPLTGGGSSYRRSVPIRPDLLDYSVRILRRLQWHGVAMVEFKVAKNGEAHLMEINPRLWGSLALPIDCGMDFPSGLLSLASGGSPLPRTTYRAYYYTRSLRRDAEWFKANLRASHSDPLLLTRPRFTAFLELFRPFILRESWDHFNLHDHNVVRGILVQTVRAQFESVFRKVHGLVHKIYLQRIQQPRILRAAGRRPCKNLLFLCYGNICRSPLASEMAKKLAGDLNITSAGFFRRVDRSSPEFMLRIGSSMGCDLSAHRSQRIDKPMAESADLIIIMDRRNFRLLQEEFPQYLHKAAFLGSFLSPTQLEIEDPYGLPDEQAREVCAKLRLGVEGLIRWVNKSGASKPARVQAQGRVDY